MKQQKPLDDTEYITNKDYKRCQEFAKINERNGAVQCWVQDKLYFEGMLIS